MLIGEVTSPQGLHGEVRVYPHTDFPERFLELDQVSLEHGREPARFVKITSSRIAGRVIVLKLEGVETRDDAERLRGARLLIPHSRAVALGENEYYYHQLIGLEVVTTAGESLGPITAIWPTGANDVYETELALIPAVKEFIREVDLDHGRMVVEARPGLKKSDPGT
ncbi:MAG: ribosome maturation factor RimM [Armatimonadota bacterium]